jgi:chromosome segregation ATPase
MLDRGFEETQIEDIEASLNTLKKAATITKEELDEIRSELADLKISLIALTDKLLKESLQKRARACDDGLAELRKKVLLTSASGTPHGFFRDAEAKQSDSLSILQRSQQRLIETEKVAVDTITQLHKQKEIIKKTQNNLGEVNEQLSKSNHLLRRMSAWWRG